MECLTIYLNSAWIMVRKNVILPIKKDCVRYTFFVVLRLGRLNISCT